MARLTWDGIGERLYETGTDHGVIYPISSTGTYPTGVAWNGLTSVSESPSGAEPTDLWADNIKYLTLRSAEQFGFTIEAYTYPDEFAECNGEKEIIPGVFTGQQPRKAFGFCYRSVIGNDTDGDKHGYKLHIIYGATASPSEKAYNTINDSPEAITFSWECTCVPVNVENQNVEKPVYEIVIDSTQVDETKLSALEDILYGSSATGSTSDPHLPLPDEIISVLT